MQTIQVESRNALLSGGTDKDGKNIVRRRVGDGMREQSSKVTDSLTTLVSKMSDQVKQSEETLHHLVGSSQVLTETEQEFGTMGSTIQSSGKLLSKYSRRECTDKILFALAILFFFCVVLYILKKRLWGGFW